jgi:hypothetical protein
MRKASTVAQNTAPIIARSGSSMKNSTKIIPTPGTTTTVGGAAIGDADTAGAQLSWPAPHLSSELTIYDGEINVAKHPNDDADTGCVW